MPLYASIPLPGPFRYVKRIGGGGQKRGLLWWLIALPVLMVWLPVKWLVLGTVWVCRKTYALINNR